MIHKLRIVAAALALIGLSSAAWSVDIPKVTQLPDMFSGWNLQSQWDAIDGEPNVIRADNWWCPDGRPITDVHWWGSYLFNQIPQENMTFEISIHANDPGTNLPGQLLYREMFDLDPRGIASEGLDANQEEVFQYKVYLETPFQQTEGEIYWLDIVALTPDQKRWPMWGWHTAIQAQMQELEGAAITDAPPDPANPDRPDLDRPWQNAQYDMAFELTTIPEPSLVALFGLGVFAAWRRFRRP